MHRKPCTILRRSRPLAGGAGVLLSTLGARSGCLRLKPMTDAWVCCKAPEGMRRIIVIAVLVAWVRPAAADSRKAAASTEFPGTSAAAPGATARPLAARMSAHTSVYADSDHVTVVTPAATAEIGDAISSWHAKGQYLVDVVSAASVDIVSTASQRWQEVRQAGEVDAGYKWRRIGAQATAAMSSEPDYASLAGGGNLTWDFGDKSHTAVIGYSLDHDRIGRTGTPIEIFSRSFWQHTVNGGVSLTLNRSALLLLVSDVVVERGDQSKPYRYIPMFSPAVAPTIARGASIDAVNSSRLPERPLEHLPESRERYALTARFGYRFAHSTLRIDERLYTDTWRLHASTTDARYFLELSKRLTVWPHLRAHAQTAVYFWRRAYVASAAGTSEQIPRFRTGDRELGPLATLTAGVGGTFNVGPATNPSGFMVDLQGDFMGTDFLDDLYVRSRSAALVSAGLVGVFQ